MIIICCFFLRCSALGAHTHVRVVPEHVFECKPEHVQYPCVLLQQRIPSYTIYYSPPTQR